MDVLSKEQRHKNMSRIRSRDTSIELILRKALWRNGIRFRKNYKKLPGSPDIVLTRYRIAIFCDSEFFHGYRWETLKQRLDANRDFWIRKIEKNMSRDERVDRLLEAGGWTVLRFWGREIIKNTDACVETVIDAVYDSITEAYGRDA